MAGEDVLKRPEGAEVVVSDKAAKLEGENQRLQ